MSKEIVLKYSEHPELPEEARILMWIEGEQYKGMVEQASSIGDAMKQLGIGLWVKEQYENSKQPQP